jgi:hypothetical protein
VTSTPICLRGKADQKSASSHQVNTCMQHVNVGRHGERPVNNTKVLTFRSINLDWQARKQVWASSPSSFLFPWRLELKYISRYLCLVSVCASAQHYISQFHPNRTHILFRPSSSSLMMSYFRLSSPSLIPLHRDFYINLPSPQTSPPTPQILSTPPY